MNTGNDGMECIEKQSAHSIPPLPHTHRWFARTPTIRMVIQLAYNQSENPMAQTADSQTFSDFACWIGAVNVHPVSKAFNAAEHTKQICSRTRTSLSKCFRHPKSGPVCSCLYYSSSTQKNDCNMLNIFLCVSWTGIQEIVCYYESYYDLMTGYSISFVSSCCNMSLHPSGQ